MFGTAVEVVVVDVVGMCHHAASCTLGKVRGFMSHCVGLCQRVCVCVVGELVSE